MGYSFTSFCNVGFPRNSLSAVTILLPELRAWFCWDSPKPCTNNNDVVGRSTVILIVLCPDWSRVLEWPTCHLLSKKKEKKGCAETWDLGCHLMELCHHLLNVQHHNAHLYRFGSVMLWNREDLSWFRRRVWGACNFIGNIRGFTLTLTLEILGVRTFLEHFFQKSSTWENLENIKKDMRILCLFGIAGKDNLSRCVVKARPEFRVNVRSAYCLWALCLSYASGVIQNSCYCCTQVCNSVALFVEITNTNKEKQINNKNNNNKFK